MPRRRLHSGTACGPAHATPILVLLLVATLQAARDAKATPIDCSIVLDRVHARCPCQFRVRARRDTAPFDLVLVANDGASYRRVPAFRARNRTVRNADRLDAVFRYHALHVPLRASVTLLVCRSAAFSSLSVLSVSSPELYLLESDSNAVAASNSIHVHLVASTRSSRCPALLDQQQSNGNINNTEAQTHENSAVPRVVGGDVSGAAIAASLVYFLIRSRDGRARSCSGTLVSSRTVITAAHCGVDTDSIAYLGGRQGYPSSGKRYSVSDVHTAPLFSSLPENDFRRFYYDVAVVTLSKDAPANSNFMLVNVNRSLPLPGSAVRVAGYGILAHDDLSSNKHSVLHHVDVPVVPGKSCRSLYAKNDVNINYDYQVCAGYVGRGGCDSWYVFFL